MASNLFNKPPLESPGGINQNLIQKFNSFNIEPVQYPSDLGGEDLKHWVQFTINVRGKSFFADPKNINGAGRLGTERALDPVIRGPDSANLTTEELSRSSATLLPLAVAGVVGGAAYSKLTDRSSKTGGTSIAGKIVGTVAAGAAAGLATYIFQKYSDQLKPDTTFKISDAIALYVDGPPTVRYAAQYSNKDLGTIAGLAAGGASAVASGEGVASLAAQFAKLPGALGVNLPDVISASAKVSLNPFKEVIFEAVDFRAFNFKYRFFPKSRQEADNVEKIIKLFKFHMHPDLSSNKLFFIYPSEFEIAYFYESNENTYFHKLKPCVLESMDISYGGEQFSSFRDGIPTEVNVTLTFRETEILTKKQIRDGY
jgi:hypothetical protein